jgi:transcriptional regulator of met regulon
LEHSDFVNLSYKVWHFFELVSLRIFDQNALNSVFSLVAEIAGVKLLFFGCFEVMRNIEWEEIIRWAGSRLLNVDKLSRLIQDSLPRGYLNERFLTPFVDQKLEADKDLKASLSPDVEILRELYRDPYASDGEGFEESEPYDSLPRGYLNERFLTPFVDQKLEADKDLEASLSPDVEILRELYRDPYASDGEGFEESEPYT